MALMVSVASGLFVLESLIPNPVPWFRLGLANIITLLAITWWGVREALIILILRVVLGSLLAGRFLHPIFVLSLSGGVAATLVMGLCSRFGEKIFSMIGISVCGALSKNVTQLIVVYLIYIRQISIFHLLPLFLSASLLAGLLIGFMAYLIDVRMKIRDFHFQGG
jgi:heptaprenyl diphosphate synthase